jgi:putative transposase
MTIARQVVAHRTYLMTRRCTQRQLLLRPDPLVEQIYLYCLGEAAARFGITLHAFLAMSNHQHLIVRDNLGNYPEFLAHFHKMVSKAMNALLERSENFWATEQPNAVYLVEARDRFDKLVYVLANPVADDLVDRVSDWPGASSFRLHVSGGTRTVKRPRGFFRVAGKMPAEVSLHLERPEGFESLTDEEWTAKVLAAVRGEEERARTQRLVHGKRVLGRKGVLRAERTDKPKTAEPRRTLRPCIACLEKSRRVRELEALLAFRAERRAALLRFLAADPDVVFPLGTYRVRGVFVVKAPPPDPSTPVPLAA